MHKSSIPLRLRKRKAKLKLRYGENIDIAISKTFEKLKLLRELKRERLGVSND